jgi:hypothetical protein
MGWVFCRQGLSDFDLDSAVEVGRFPGKGHRRSDRTNRDVLFFSVYQYLIIVEGQQQ